MVKAEYHDLEQPIPSDDVLLRIRQLGIDGSPATATAGIKTGYLWRFSPEGLRIVRELIGGLAGLGRDRAR
jgi:hypothetical protein